MRATVALFVVAGLATGLVLPVPTARGQGSATEEARQHFLKGQQLFDVGRWDDAAEEFEKAYATRGDPIFIYNMAQSYRRKGDAKRALDLYKNYLIKAPKSPQRPEVEERIRALQKQVEEAEYAVKPPSQSSTSPSAASPSAALPALVPAAPPAAPPLVAPAPAPVAPAPAPVAPTSTPGAPTPATVVYTQAVQPASASPQVAGATPTQAVYPGAASGSADAYSSSVAPGAPQASYLQAEATPQATPGHGLRVAGVVCGVVGVAAIGAGIFFGAEASSYSHSVETATVFNPNFQDRGKLYENLQWVGYGVGAGLVATGAVLYGIGAVSARSSAVALAPTVFPGGAGLSAQGVF